MPGVLKTLFERRKKMPPPQEKTRWWPEQAFRGWRAPSSSFCRAREELQAEQQSPGALGWSPAWLQEFLKSCLGFKEGCVMELTLSWLDWRRSRWRGSMSKAQMEKSRAGKGGENMASIKSLKLVVSPFVALQSNRLLCFLKCASALII